MLTSLRIQNFRSIRDASVKLGQVNLFIGPNNSGKSNFLKATEFAAFRVFKYPNEQFVPIDWYEASIPRGTISAHFPPIFKISIGQQISEDTFCEIHYAIQGFYSFVTGEKKTETLLEAFFGKKQDESIAYEALDLRATDTQSPIFPQVFSSVRRQLNNCILYKIEPTNFLLSVGLSHEPVFRNNGSNIANFIHTLSQNNEGLFSQLKKDFARCVGNLVSFSTPPDPFSQGNLRLKFFDAKNNSYWAEEVSEGVLYFLALLCIVHQPDPPKLLLLEEPEKGIHPRRIREVMDFIFELARLRDIQIILTSHSPYVVDIFSDYPENISIFDRDPETGETLVKNAADYIKETNDELVAAGLPAVNYTESLGENWVSGFLGGVPL